MSKTTLISITQVEGNKPKAMIETYADGAFLSRSSRELSADGLISLICELYDIEPNHLTPKKKFACKHCGHVYEKKQTCTQCLGKVKPVKTAKK